jgi:hypothetical protein
MAYWAMTLALIVVGYLTLFSVGVLLLPIGLAMAVLGRFRHRQLVFWPPMAALLAFLAGYIAIAPLICAASDAPDGPSRTQCSSLIGIGYSGGGTYNPSLLPAALAGLALATLMGLLVLGFLWRAARHSAGRHS